MQVCVLGAGYVGLVSGACLAEIGHDVICVDLDAGKVAAINQGASPIHEDGLDAILHRNVGTRLNATTNLADACETADIILICVGTPFDGEKIDLSFVLAAARDIGTQLAKRSDWCVVVVKSTVVPGTTIGPVREALEQASGKRAGMDFGLGMNPEFLAEGTAVKDFMNPDRIVVGGIEARSMETLAEMYRHFKDTPLLKTNPSTAEMIKYGSNSLLATLISFTNEIAQCCEAIGDVDVADVMPGIHQMSHLKPRQAGNRDQPVSAASFLWPGCGFGGSCFPKDVKALIAQAKSNNVPVPLLSAVIAINQEQPLRLVKLVKTRLGGLEGKRIALLGLAFKPGTDDVRESPALAVLPELVRQGAVVTGHDPIAVKAATDALSQSGFDTAQATFTEDLAEAISGCDAAVIVTRWPEYDGVAALMNEGSGGKALLIDGRRMIAASTYPNYFGLGRS
jgi:UDPglucose 6-dehydrogenase